MSEEVIDTMAEEDLHPDKDIAQDLNQDTQTENQIILNTEEDLSLDTEMNPSPDTSTVTETVPKTVTGEAVIPRDRNNSR